MWTTLLQAAGVVVGAAVFEFIRRMSVRQRKVARVLDWIAETIDEPNPGKPPDGPRPTSASQTNEKRTPSSRPPPSAA